MDRNLQGPKNDGSHINTLNSAQKRNSKIEAYDRWTQSSHIVIEHCPIRSRPPIAHSPAQNASQRREPGSEQRQKNKTTRAQVPPRTNPWDHRKGGGGGGETKTPAAPEQSIKPRNQLDHGGHLGRRKKKRRRRSSSRQQKQKRSVAGGPRGPRGARSRRRAATPQLSELLRPSRRRGEGGYLDQEPRAIPAAETLDLKNPRPRSWGRK